MSNFLFRTKEEIEKNISKLSKTQLLKLYDFITNYFENYKQYGLEERPEQYSMALSVYDSIASLDHFIIEAGVGIGKSYAYLIPLMYYNYLTNKPFIISTSTIALEEQLENDIKRLSQQLNIPINIVVAKGMNNFMCLKRISNNQFNSKYQDRKYYPNISDKEWDLVNVGYCSYNNCEKHKDCEFYNRREEMKNTNGVIICNHDLLIMDLARKENKYNRQLFKNVSYIVCDEAHNLENKIRSFMTKSFVINELEEIITDSIKILERYNNYEYDYKKSIDLVKKLSATISNNINIEIEKLKLKGIDLIDCSGINLTFDNNILILLNEIYKLLGSINNSLQKIQSVSTYNVRKKVLKNIDIYKEFFRPIESDYLFWIERKYNKDFIYYSPKDISKISYDLFFNNQMLNKDKLNKTFIFTSATLSTGDNNYSYFMNNIGADKIKKGLTVEYSYDSPYDYDNNALLYCCNDIENPSLNKEKYLNQLVDKIKELIKLTNGKAMVLFTSKSDMNYVYNKIGNKLDNINIYIQNDGSSQKVVKDKFKNEINSVLFSTGIFGEGIDIKGEALSNLIIARLPFPIVNPIMECKKNSFAENGFQNVYIPEMIIKLKQGIGRLIRSKDDKGIVCILDSRMNNKYQEVIKESIPIKNFTTDINDVKKLVKKYNIDK